MQYDIYGRPMFDSHGRPIKYPTSDNTKLPFLGGGGKSRGHGASGSWDTGGSFSEDFQDKLRQQRLNDFSQRFGNPNPEPEISTSGNFLENMVKNFHYLPGSIFLRDVWSNPGGAIKELWEHPTLSTEYRGALKRSNNVGNKDFLLKSSSITDPLATDALLMAASGGITEAATAPYLAAKEGLPLLLNLARLGAQGLVEGATYTGLKKVTGSEEDLRSLGQNMLTFGAFKPAAELMNLGMLGEGAGKDTGKGLLFRLFPKMKEPMRQILSAPFRGAAAGGSGAIASLPFGQGSLEDRLKEVAPQAGTMAVLDTVMSLLGAAKPLKIEPEKPLTATQQSIRDQVHSYFHPEETPFKVETPKVEPPKIEPLAVEFPKVETPLVEPQPIRVESKPSIYEQQLRQQLAKDGAPEHYYDKMYRDTGTGLMNRTGYHEVRGAIPEGSLFVKVDLKGVKKGNEQFSHDGMNMVFQHFADFAQSVNPDLAARLGGDEFTFVFHPENAEAGSKAFRDLQTKLRGATIELEYPNGTKVGIKGADFRYGEHSNESIAENRLTAIDNAQKAAGETRDTVQRYTIEYVQEPGQQPIRFSNPQEGEVYLRGRNDLLGTNEKAPVDLGNEFNADREGLRQMHLTPEEIDQRLSLKENQQPLPITEPVAPVQESKPIQIESPENVPGLQVAASSEVPLTTEVKPLPVKGSNGLPVHQARTNSYERNVNTATDVKEQMGIDPYTYESQTNVKQEADARANIVQDERAVIKRLKKTKSINGGVEAYEAAILLDKFAKEAHETGDYTQFNSFSALLAEKIGKTGEALQAWDAAIQKASPEGAVLEAQKVVKKAQDTKFDKDPMLREKVNRQEKQVKSAVENAQKDAAEMLAKRVENSVKPRKPSPDDGINKQVVDELYRVAKESPLPEREGIKAHDPREFLRQAVQLKDKYTDVWLRAKEMVRQKFADNPVALRALDDYFDKGIVPTYSRKTLLNSMKVANKDLEIRLTEVAKSTGEEKAKALSDLTDYLIGYTGATREEADLLAKQVATEFEAQVAAKTRAALKPIFEPKPPKSEPTDSLKTVKELGNLGAFRNENYLEQVAAKLKPNVRKLLRESGIDLGKLVRKSVEDVHFTRDMFLTELETKLKINRTDATLALNEIEKIFNGLAEEKRLSVLKSMFTKRPAAPKKSYLNRVMELVHLGAYDDVGIVNLIKEKEGLPVLTPEEAKKLMGIMEEAKRLPEGSYEQHKKFDEANQFIASKAPKSILGIVIDVANVSKTLRSSFDLSALRQGFFLIGHDPVKFAKAMSAFKALKSDRDFFELAKLIRDDPDYELARKAGLGLTEVGESLLGPHEEGFMSSIAKRVPGVAASERAYVAFLNKLRFDTFKDLVKKSKLQGIDLENNPSYAKEIANFVNIFSGRGPLPKGLERSAQAFNGLFFSPRLMLSRMHILFDWKMYIKASPVVRRAALKSLFGTLGMSAAALSLASLAPGVTVCKDPRNADFAKIKVGNTRIDIMGGLQQYVRMMTQLATQTYISSTTGKEVTLGEGYKPLTMYDIFLRQIESKEAPVPAFITKLMKQQNYKGEPLDVTKETFDLFTPMIISDVKELLKNDPNLLPLEVLNFFGIGSLQTYDQYTPKNKESLPFLGGGRSGRSDSSGRTSGRSGRTR